MPSESRARASDQDYCRTNVGHTGMVYSSSKFADRPPQSFQGNQGCSIQSFPGQSSPFEPQISINGMQNIRHNLPNLKVSPEVADVIMRSWKSGTQKQYTTYLTKWTEFCIPRKIDSMRPTVNNVLNFLHTLYAQDLSYSTINTAHSALSACLLDTTFSGTTYTMTNLPLLIRYMKAVFNSRDVNIRPSLKLGT